MPGHDMVQGLWWLMWFLPVLALVVVALLLLRDSPRWWFERTREHFRHHETAREILDRRYASGEIDRRQYEEMRQVLNG
jgi:putative membrane protein